VSAPTLTIAVPTFRRATWLRRCLSEVLEQVAALPRGGVEVVVSDNASPDDTPAVLAGLKALHPALRVHRNPRNIGPEANFRRLRELARGEYLWLLGDDDLLLPGAVARVLDLIARGYDYMVFDFLACDEALERVCRPSLFGRAADVPLAGPGDVLRKVGLGAGYISINVARRGCFGTLPDREYERFARWGMAYFMDTCAGLARLRRGILVATPILKGRRSPLTDFPPGFNFFAWFLEGPHEAGRALARDYGYPPRAVAAFERRLLRHTAWRRLAYERLTGRLDVAEARRILRGGFGGHLWFWLLCAPFLYLPGTGALVRLGVRLAGGERGRRLLGAGEG
jgi:glycosyltransferase involved in cell wall biosynthesis